MKTKFYWILLSVLVLTLPFVYEFLSLALPRKLNFDRFSFSIYWFFISIGCGVFFLYCQSLFERFAIIKYAFISFMIRVFINPFLMAFEMSIGLIGLCKRPVTPSEEQFVLDLVIDVSKFIFLVVILRFKLKDIFISSALVALSILFEMFLKYILLN